LFFFTDSSYAWLKNIFTKYRRNNVVELTREKGDFGLLRDLLCNDATSSENSNLSSFLCHHTPYKVQGVRVNASYVDATSWEEKRKERRASEVPEETKASPPSQSKITSQAERTKF